MNKPKNQARRRFLKWTLGAAAVSSGVVGYEGRVDANALTVTERDVHIVGWPQSAAGLRVGQLSDLHCDNAQAVARTERAVRMLLAQKPDIVFLTGDYITYKPRRWAAPAVQALAPLTQVPLGCVSILGNHDWWSGGGLIMARHLGEAGMTMLRNQSVPFPTVDGAWIVGLDDVCVDKQDAETALQGVPSDACKILLVHEPDFADQSPPGFALQLSGHSHAGQIRIPGLPPLHCPKFGRHYPEGLQQSEHHPVYTTRGVGMVGPQIRLFCPPEVTLLRLFPKTMMPLSPAFDLSHLISIAVTPVVLISTTAILLSGYTGKYANISDRLRDLTAEYRSADTSAERRTSLKAQMRLFHRRVSAVWAASALLSMALLSFLATVLSVIFDTRHLRLDWGALCLILGLALMAGAVLLELYEIRLARMTVAGELSDIF